LGRTPDVLHFEITAWRQGRKSLSENVVGLRDARIDEAAVYEVEFLCVEPSVFKVLDFERAVEGNSGADY
jgi:hypothetical protein